ncbi:MAG: hypothetical protein KDD92_08270 [Caldilineaceae bacterium]|nr:hypothetical protein [Caldilineaceae bacterium]
MPSLLFVCTANRIRSPLAEYLFRSKLKQQADLDPADVWQIESAGTWAQPDRPPMASAMSVAAQYGMDISSHRSRSVDAVDLNRFDLILTMETSQRDALRSEFPSAADRIYTLAEAATGFAYDIDDPIGRSDAVFHRTLVQLDDLLDQGWERLNRAAVYFSSRGEEDV